MTTSGVNTFSVNRNQIIRLALLNLAKLEENETPSAQEITDMSMMLNMMVKQWQGKADFAPGLKTWTRRHGYLFLNHTTGKYTIGPGGTGWTNNFVSTSTASSAAAGQPVLSVASATGMSIGDRFGVLDSTGTLAWGTILLVVGTTITLSSNLTNAVASGAVVYAYTTAANQPIEIEQVFLRDSTGSDTPIKQLTSAEYDALPAKANTTNISDPAAIYYEFQLVNSLLWTDVAGAQDMTKYLCFTYMEAEEDFVNPSDTPEYPQEWYLPLALGLSKLAAPMFKVSWTPVMEDNYKMALAIAQKKEPENVVTYFQPYEIA